MTPVDLTRRFLLSPILPANAGTGRVPRLSMPSAPPPGGTPRGQSLSGIVDRLKESLPTKLTGKDDLDFALVAAPLLDLLAELADDRALATKDPVMRKVCGRIAGEGAEILQTLIDWLETKGHAAR